jgi:hypothetical protein
LNQELPPPVHGNSSHSNGREEDKDKEDNKTIPAVISPIRQEEEAPKETPSGDGMNEQGMDMIVYNCLLMHMKRKPINLILTYRGGGQGSTR